MEIKCGMWIEENGRLLPGRARVEIVQDVDGQNSLKAAWAASGTSSNVLKR